MSKFDLMNGNYISLNVMREFVTVRDLMVSLGHDFAHKIPVYFNLGSHDTLKLSRPKTLDMISSVNVEVKTQNIADLYIGDLYNDCTAHGALDLPIHIIFHGRPRLVRSFEICRSVKIAGLVWIDLLTDIKKASA